MPNSKQWSLILHGGAKTISADKQAENRAGLAEALTVGREFLCSGGAALDAVEAVVRKLEELPTFNAGVGSVKNDAGEVELDASIMDGTTLDIGAVAGLQGFCHPVSVARALLREKAILLVGEGAKQFAKSRGAERANLDAASVSGPGGDTVGCVALDMEGNLAVATSTGGLEGAVAGRVGDVPLPGCGFYADNARGALSLSGEGEAIARVMLAAETMMRMQHQSVQSAAESALQLLKKVDGEAGIIVIGPSGAIGWAHNSSHFAVALATSAMPGGSIFLRKVS
jgi:beta-aspartyl-peptidase (threonine type)